MVLKITTNLNNDQNERVSTKTTGDSFTKLGFIGKPQSLMNHSLIYSKSLAVLYI